MRLDSPLSATARPFQSQAASALVDNGHHDLPAWNGLTRGSPTTGLTPGSPVRRGPIHPRDTFDEERVSTDTSTSEKSVRKRHGSRRSRGSQSGSDSDGRRKKKDGFSRKIQIPKFGGKKGHPHDVADAFRQWAHCITYYREYYEDSCLMPLVVSSLRGDASDVSDWIYLLFCRC